MKSFLLKLIFILLLVFSINKTYAQCTGCALTITVPSSSNYDLSSYTGQTICIVGSGSFTGKLNNFNGNTLCIGTGVTYNPSTAPNYNGNWTIINNGTFSNTGNLNFNSGNSFTNATTGTISLGSVSISSGNTFANYGSLNASSITINSGGNVTLGGTTTISGSLTNNSTLTIIGSVVANGITNNSSGSIIGGVNTYCNSIKSTGAFSNTGTIGGSGSGLYVGNIGGTITSPATSTAPSAPTSQPTALNLSISGTTISGSFTQSGTASSGYLIIRAIAASPPAITNPTNLAALSVGQSLGAWAVVAINDGQTTTTFSDNVGATCTNVNYAIFSFSNAGTTSCRVYKTSTPLTKTFSPIPTITSTTPGTRSGTGTVTLSATSSNGSVNWYSASTSGTILATATSYVTPSISVTTTYYVEAVNGTCTSSPRVAIVATVNQPGINVLGNNVVIANGDITPSTTDWTDFVSTNVNSAITRIYTIANSGAGNLSLTGTPIVTATGTDFTITTQPTTTVLPADTTTFVVTFNPITIGVKTSTISITSNDPTKNPYTFKITGVGIQAFVDTDGDGIFNNVDLDDDNDGIPDSIEQNYASASVLATTTNIVLLNETFGVGTTRARINSNIPTASTTYCYEDGTIAQASDECDTNPDLNDGQYTVNYESGSLAVASWAPQYWYQGSDHTFDTNGRMALFNATSNITDEFYRTVVQGVITGAPLTYSFWILNLDRANAPGIATRYRPNITVEFRDLSNNLISVINTGDIAPSAASPASSDWKQFSSTFTPTTTGFSIIFKNNQVGGIGNDLALDDILITQKLADTDGDGIPDVYDLDSDNDGIGDIVEDGWSSLSNGKDTMDLTSGFWVDANHNGWNDIAEAYYIAGGTPKNADGDAVPNYIDLDSDNDSIFDTNEAGLYFGDGDVNDDGKGDGNIDTDKDGILDQYDNYVGFGTIGKILPTNTLGTGDYDYLKTISKTAGVYDISTTLYASLDADNDGKIDGTTDIDRDGILDALDTNTAYYGSPRDLSRKLLLNFDGRNDYGQENVQILDGLSNATLMAWIDLNSAFSSDGVVVGQNKFQLRVTSARNIEAVVNNTVLTYSTVALNKSQWYHVGITYDGTTLKLYLNGLMVKSVAASGSITSDGSKLTIAKDPTTTSKFFKGKIDEIRIFNVALTDSQFQRMVYQEIQNTGAQVRGLIVPIDIGSLAFSNVLRYFRMDTYKDDIIDDLTTPTIDVGIGMKIYNVKNISVQQAPMPFVTKTSGTFATAVNNTTNDIRGQDIMDQDWSIVQVKNNITDTSNNIDLGMFVDPGITITMNNDTKIQNDWYLKLDGTIDLIGKSQLVQTTNSVLDVTSAGSILRDQQGQSNKYNYNYWSSPVSTINTTSNNNAYTIAGVMKDGTTGTPQNITWTTGVDGSPTSPITLSSYWIFKFQNLSNSYANWQSVGASGLLNAGQGYTLKGSGASTATQNYTFVGKPNNGLITNPVAAGNLNISGNPYPSAIDANAFINDNSSVLDGTLYFWQHYATNNTHVLANYQGGYAALNLVGGTPPVSPLGISGLGSSLKKPTRFIPVGQSFFVTANAIGGNITFNNNQRIFIKEDNAASFTMFKNVGALAASNLNNNSEDPFTEDTYKRIRLGYNFINNSLHRQVLIGYMENNATSGIDVGYDALDFDDNPDDMYIINNNNNLTISGESYFNDNDTFPIGVKLADAGTVQFIIDGTENFDTNQNIYIYDNLTSIYHHINTDAFEISLPAGTLNDRFSLRFKDATLSTGNSATLDNNIKVVFTNSNNILTIKNNKTDVTVNSIEIYTILGQLLSTVNVENQDQRNIQIPVENVSAGTYIARIITSSGTLSTKMIIK